MVYVMDGKVAQLAHLAVLAISVEMPASSAHSLTTFSAGLMPCDCVQTRRSLPILAAFWPTADTCPAVWQIARFAAVQKAIVSEGMEFKSGAGVGSRQGKI